jgi:ribonucleoside-diphosphate reductase alpha chain
MPRQPLPTRRPNLTTDALWHDHLITVTVGFDLSGNPREVFANTLRGGDMQAAVADACVLISIALQSGIEANALAKSLGRVPVHVMGDLVEAPASPIGTILDCILEAA